MNRSSSCPRCRVALVPQPDASFCPECGGTFVPANQVQEKVLADALAATAQVVAAAAGPADAAATTPVLTCPACGCAMRALVVVAVEVDRCGSCGGVWLDAGESLCLPEPADAGTWVGRTLLYSLSLPERAVRSSIGLAAGAAREAAAFLVPQAFQDAKTYEIIVGNSLKFLAEDIGGAKSAAANQGTTSDYLARKAVGNFVELAGLSTLHVSPLWILAVASDVAYGTRSYLTELAQELKQQGLIDETSTICRAEDVLEALRRTSGTAAGLFDTPPLSVDELRRSLEETRAAAQSADLTALLPEAELGRYWREMREISQREGVSLLGVSGALTLHSLDKLKTVSQGALTGIRVAGGLLNRLVLGHYVQSLRDVQERGFYQTVRESYAPYVAAVWSNFSIDKESWTEQIVSGKALGNAYAAVMRWFGQRHPTNRQKPHHSN